MPNELRQGGRPDFGFSAYRPVAILVQQSAMDQKADTKLNSDLLVNQFLTSLELE